MFNKLKVAQAEKQIYPQSVVNNKVEEAARAATRNRRSGSGLGTSS